MRFPLKEKGAISLEYAFLAMLILLVAFIGVAGIGQETAESFSNQEMADAFNP